jgi:hypothetical protein
MNADNTGGRRNKRDGTPIWPFICQLERLCVFEIPFKESGVGQMGLVKAHPMMRYDIL